MTLCGALGGECHPLLPAALARVLASLPPLATAVAAAASGGDPVPSAGLRAMATLLRASVHGDAALSVALGPFSPRGVRKVLGTTTGDVVKGLAK